MIDRSAALTAAVMVGIANHVGHLRPESATLMRHTRLGFVIGGPFSELCETFKERLRVWLASGVSHCPPAGVDIIDVNHTDGRGLALIAATKKK